MKVSYFTNQQQNLVYFLAQAGITDVLLRQATMETPIAVDGIDLDVTAHAGLSMIHFCRSTWSTGGTERRVIKAHHRLTHHPLVRLMEEPPKHQRRYDVAADLFFDGSKRAAILLIKTFDNPRELPAGINFQLEGEKLIENVDVPFFAHPSRHIRHELACST